MKYNYFKFKDTIKKHDRNISHIAKDLGITRVTVYSWIEKLNRDEQIFKSGKAEERAEVEKKNREFFERTLREFRGDKKSKDMPEIGLSSALYKRGAMLLHPDKGGDDELFITWKNIFK